MRIKLFLSFAIVIFVALGIVFLTASFSAEEQVRRYFGRSSLAGVDSLTEELETFYNTQSDWQDVASLFDSNLEEPAAMSETATVALTAPATTEESTQHAGMGKGQGSGSNLPLKGYQQTQEYLNQLTGTPSPEQTQTPVTEQVTGGSGPMSGQGFGMGRGRSGHILTDNAGTVVYSQDPAEIGTKLEEGYIDSAIPLTNDSQTVGYLIPEGGIPNLPYNFEGQLIERIQKATLWAAVASGVIAIVLALILSGAILRPVKALTHAATRLSEGDLEQRVQLKGNNELTKLGNTFNQMATSLQDVEKQRRAMTADIAHELRTPLAVQQANLEALQDGIYPLTQDAITPIIEQNKLLTRLVDDLRTIAMADSGELSLNLRPIDLNQLTQTVTQRFQTTLAASNIDIALQSQDNAALVLADPERIEQILHNLLQNAQRYSKPNTSITVSIVDEQGNIKLSIRDQGPGIPEEYIDKVFERFYRVDKSRGRENGGTGLGLAIARKLAEVHNGTLTAENHPDGGAIFTLSLPKL